jgi:hypothetical protein
MEAVPIVALTACNKREEACGAVAAACWAQMGTGKRNKQNNQADLAKRISPSRIIAFSKQRIFALPLFLEIYNPLCLIPHHFTLT